MQIGIKDFYQISMLKNNFFKGLARLPWRQQQEEPLLLSIVAVHGKTII